MSNMRSLQFRVRLSDKTASLAILLLLLFGLSAPSLAQKPATLRRIEFVGLKKLTAPQAIEASGLKIGDPISPDVIDAAAEKLMQSGLFRKLGYKLRTT
ncbi:MAG: hypothetical protein QOF72_1517, partial [Blastocatellia bacterium]|nr:hypothetical protein [Blastocatellia bacterium]